MAGHSKFKNIMHRKDAQDQKRAKLFTKIIREISVAVSIAGVDPNFNPRLRMALLSAREANLPKDKVEATIKKASSSNEGAGYEEIRYEGYGPSGTAFIVEALTDNRNRTASEVRSTFGKGGGALGETGSVSYNFEKAGLIAYPVSVCDPEVMMEAALEAEINDCDVHEEWYEILCAFEKFHEVREFLEKKFGEPASAKIIWKPNLYHEIDNQDKINSVIRLIDALEELDDVQSVWTNLQFSEK